MKAFSRYYQAILLVILSALSGFAMIQAAGAEQPSLHVTEGWVRLTPPIAKNGAAYFTLHNSSNKTITVVDVTTKIAETASMHKVEIDRSMARMVHMKELEIAPGEKVPFAPGGNHLMLINLTTTLAENMQVHLHFKLKNGEVIMVNVPVVKNGLDSSEKADEHQHHH